MDSFTNELINEKSPYLLQHATNPVNWYPWGEKAFFKARNLDIPIFLSIGYATCHWCHVMEKESFQNQEIAEDLNKSFVCIKVDREEMPHIDSLYMDFAQAFISSGGGWPLNIILTPDLKPFFATTYMPPENGHGLMGLREMIYYIENLWNGEERKEIMQQADQLVEIYRSCMPDKGEEFLTSDELMEVSEEVLEDCDEVFGGFKKSPKFPFSYHSDFFLALNSLNSDKDFSSISKLTLEKMRSGGIYDHLGGGFSRYSVDEMWQVPHFEKMLYDNALLSQSYVTAYQYFKDEDFKEVAKDTLSYMQRELFSSKAFYSAEDADSEGLEGLYYIWDYEELVLHLSDDEREIFLEYFGIEIDGSFDGSNILHIAKSKEVIAKEMNVSVSEVDNHLKTSIRKLFNVREQRESPLKDDKILTSWNALSIIAHCKAFEVLLDKEYLIVAIDAMGFILENLFQNGELFRRYREEEVKYRASFEDYSYLISALLSLFDITSEANYLLQAIFFTEKVEDLFKAKDGAYFSSKEDDNFVILRKCEMVDGALPSPNAMHAENLLRLYILTKEERFKNSLEDVLKAGSNSIMQHPKSCMYFLKVYLRYLTKKDYLIVIALDENRSLEKELRTFFSKEYIPFKSIIWKTNTDNDFKQRLNYLDSMRPLDGQTAVYVCDKDKCYPPILKIEDLSIIISLCD